MALVSLTLNAFYEYDNTLFDNLTFPDGIDRDVVIDHILSRAGIFEPMYTDPDYLKYAIGMWGKRHYFTFERWIKALSLEYNPLHNYDRYEFSNDSDINKANTETNTSNGSSVHTNVSAYDSSDYSPKDEEISDLTGNEKVEHGDTHNNEHSAHLYGNIGVTTSQQMLQSEIDIARFNIAEEIAKIFLEEFSVAVY